MNKPVFVRGHAPEAIGPLIQSEPVSAVRLPADLTAEIDAWANHHEISRSEAIRRLVELGLKAKK
jgi:Ribbon-helix-helix protein, copG family